MSQSCRHKLPCICRRDASEVIANVKDQIERCIQKNMSLEETMSYLQDTHQIHPYFTKTIWEQLERENPDVFMAYHLRCEEWRQTKTCNNLLADQVHPMHEHGHLNLTNPPPEVVNILCQDPELRTRLLQNLANTPSDRSEVSPQSLSLPDTNSPIVNQLQIPNDQQPQRHNQCSTPDGFACKEPESVIVHAQGEPLYPIPESEDSNNANFDYGTQSMTQNQLDLLRQQQRQDSRVPTIAQATTTAQDPSTSEIRGSIRDNSLRERQTLQLGGSNNWIHFREVFNRLQNEGSNNGMQNGESSNGTLIGGSNNGLQIGGSTNGMLNGERTNGIQIGGRTNEPLNGGRSNNGLQNEGNICGRKTWVQNGETITRIYYRRRNGQQCEEHINGRPNAGQINGLQGVIPQQNNHSQEQDIITVQDQGEPSYSTSDSETSNNSDSVMRD